MKRGITAKTTSTMLGRHEKESTATESPRKIKKLKHDGDSSTTTSTLPSKPRIDKAELEKASRKKIATDTSTTISNTTGSSTPISRSRNKKIIDSDDDDDDDDDGVQDPSFDNEQDDENVEVSPTNKKQRKIEILTQTSFQPLRMKEALDDMRPYLNKDVREYTTMAEVRAAGYAFGSHESAERFLVEKMRPSLIQSWEYKVLVALVFTNIYPQQQQQQQSSTDDSKVITKYEKTIFGKGETKDQELAVKIYCETWRNQAVALFGEFEKVSESNDAADKTAEHELKTSLLADLLLEFCKFSAQCKVLKSKSALDKIKDPNKYGIDFMLGLEQASEMANKLKHPRFIHECNTAATRFRTMMAAEHQATTTTKQAEKGTKTTKSEKQSSSAVEQQQQPPPLATTLRMTGQEKRMKVMLQRIVSGATNSAGSSDNPMRPRPFNSSWGGKSTWGVPTDNTNVDAGSENVVSNGGVDSIHAWAASSTRARYNIWGNAGGSAPNFRNGSMTSNCRSSNGHGGAPLE